MEDKKNPLISETNKDKFKVKVRVEQPNNLYNILQKIVHGEAPFSKKMSSTEIHDYLLKEENTDFLGFEKTAGEGVNIDGTFSFRSQLHLSKERLIQKDNGYYSYAKVKKIEEILTDEGVDATFSKKREGRSVITIEKDGQYIEVNFHFPSKKAEEVSIRKMTEEDGELYYFQVQKREKHISEKIKEVTEENFISLMLVNKNMAETDVEGYPKLEDETGFCKAIATYAEVYEEVINAIYQEAGITPPGDSITLKPPVAIKE